MGILPLWLAGQEIYIASEFMLFRFHRGYYPPLLATGVVGGVGQEIGRSGNTYKLVAWGEARVIYVVGMSGLPFAPGGTVGLSARVEVPSRLRFYLGFGAGMDGYSLRVVDGGGNFIRHTELRPIFVIEIAYQALVDRVFLRYGFYPTPGAVSKYMIGVGSYIGD